LTDKNYKIANEINSTNSVSVHIRRGDYINSDVNQKIYGNICTLDYYTRAISKMSESLDNPNYFIFQMILNGAKKILKSKMLNI